jgi:putative ABC transport system permease protein
VTSRLARATLRLYGVVLRLYPAAYRDEYAGEMTLLLADRLRAERGGTRAIAALTAMAAVVLEAPRLHAQMLAADLRWTARSLGREPWFAAVAIATVAVGIGLSTAVFTVGKALLVDAVPYADAERSVIVWVSNPRQGFDRDFTSYPRLVDWRRESRMLEHIAAYDLGPSVVSGTGEAEQLRVVRATAGFFEAVRATPVLGRTFAPDEEQATVAVISHGLWQRRFGGQPSAIGRVVRFDGRPYTLIGVLPPWFHFPDRDVDAWLPLQPSPQDLQARRGFWLRAIARLAPGASLRQAQQEMDAVMARLAAEHPDDRGLGITLVSLRDEIARPFRTPLLTLTGAVLGVLLIACVNVAGMLTARGAARRRDVAIRTALGASRRRVVRQLLTEAVALFVVGGVLGVGVGWTVLQALVGIAPPSLGWLQDASLDGPMLAAALSLAALTGVVFGIVPCWRSSGADVAEAVASAAKGASGGDVSQRFRRTLVIAQVAVATVVASFATLMVSSLVRAQQVDLGFRTSGVLTARVQLPRSRYPEAQTRLQFFDRLLDRVRALPGVTAAAAGSSVLLSRTPDSGAFTPEGRTEVIEQPLTLDVVTPDYFQVLGVPLVRGRMFTAADTAERAPVAIVNETTARRHWPGADPVGKRFTFGAPSDRTPWITIVGVVADTRRGGVDVPPWTESYIPHTQDPRSMTVLVRSDGDPVALATALRGVVREADPDLALANVSTVAELVDDQIAPRRFNTWLLSAFGGAAIALTAIGLYGLLAYVVALRRRELAVRLSVGASPVQVLALIVRNVSAIVATGAALGLAGAVVAATWLRSLLFGISPWDPASQGTALGVLALVTIAAAWVPVRRAMHVDPAVVLRND